MKGKTDNSYKEIMKATSIFGGVQVFEIIIKIIKSKLVAVLLGPAGMGISGLLTTTTGVIAAVTNFGLGTSGIKSIAEAEGTGNENRIAVMVSVLRKCVWLTGLLGMVVTIILSRWLSELTFGNKNYTLAFIWLSITFILNQLSTGQLIILQGLRKYKHLANASLTGALLGLLFALPMYYYWGINGIVPAIIGTSVLNLFRSWFFSRKIQIKKIKIENQLTVSEAKVMLKLGFMISLSGVSGMAASYLLRIFISNYGGIEQVGLYSAGFTLLNTYVGLIFTAMGTDYFPRLSARPNDNIYTQNTVNEQAEISFLLLAPVLVVFLIFCPIAIKILFTGKFLAIEKMLYWSILGMLIRAASWALSFIFIAKGNAKIFFINESIASIYILILNIAGYYFGGLTGIGVAFIVGYIVYFLHIAVLSYKLYNIKINNRAMKLLLVQLFFTSIIFLISINLDDLYRYIVGIPIVVGCICYSFISLDRRIKLSSFVKNYMRIKK